MVYTRSNLAHVDVVNRVMTEYEKEHWLARKRIFLYLKCTSNVGFIYEGETQCEVIRYFDSNYARNVDI